METCEGELGRVTVSLSFIWDDLGEVQKALQYILLKVQLDRLKSLATWTDAQTCTCEGERSQVSVRIVDVFTGNED